MVHYLNVKPKFEINVNLFFEKIQKILDNNSSYNLNEISHLYTGVPIWNLLGNNKVPKNVSM